VTVPGHADLRSSGYAPGMENDASRRVALRCGYRLEGPDPEPFRGLPVLRFSKRLDARSAGE